jgi:hypothetical protein
VPFAEPYGCITLGRVTPLHVFKPLSRTSRPVVFWLALLFEGWLRSAMSPDGWVSICRLVVLEFWAVACRSFAFGGFDGTLFVKRHRGAGSSQRGRRFLYLWQNLPNAPCVSVKKVSRLSPHGGRSGGGHSLVQRGERLGGYTFR